MSNGLIAFLASIGIAAWVYSRMMRQTGGNTKSALTIAAVSGLLNFIFLIILLGTIL